MDTALMNSALGVLAQTLDSFAPRGRSFERRGRAKLRDGEVHKGAKRSDGQKKAVAKKTVANLKNIAKNSEKGKHPARKKWRRVFFFFEHFLWRSFNLLGPASVCFRESLF